MINYEDGFVRDGDRVCSCRGPDDILVVVASVPEPYHVTYLGNFGDTTAVTKPVVLPRS